jgi:hypothetical protein
MPTTEPDGKTRRRRPAQALERREVRSTDEPGTVQDQIGRFRGLADVGVQTAIVSLPDVAEDHAIERFAAIIQAFAT